MDGYDDVGIQLRVTRAQAREFAAHQPVPHWMELDRENLKGRLLAVPKRDEINLPLNEQLIVELYSK